MSYYHEFEPFIEEFMEYGLGYSLLANSFSSLLGIAVYVLTALGLYTIAKRRGIKNAWLSWVPVINCWIIGSLSDQYRYVVKGEVKNKRKILLILNIVNGIIGLVMCIVAVVMAVQAATSMVGFSMVIDGGNGAELLGKAMGALFGVLALCLPLAGVSIAIAVIRYMAMYDIYMSCSPQNSVVFLVLSIIFNVTEPFFLFFIRNKDDGMPPRKQKEVYDEPQETWNQTEYL